MESLRVRVARVAVPASAIAVLNWAGAPPAAAQAVFQGTTTVPPYADSTVTMYVPHERDEQTYNVQVVVAFAAGWQPVACETKPTWTCALGSAGETSLVTFAKDEDAQRAEDETFVFTVHSPGPSTSAGFPTQQVYNTGEGINWSGPPGSAEPAPVLHTGDAAATPAPTATPPAPTLAPAPATAPVASPTSALAGDAVPAALEEADDGGFPAAAGFVAVLVLIVVGPAAVVYRLRRGVRRRRAAEPT